MRVAARRPDPDDGLAAGLLRSDPAVPSDPARFSADGDIGPGCYPEGPPMVPAVAPGPSATQVADDLARAGARSERWVADIGLASVVVDERLRVAAAALAATIGEPLLVSLASGQIVDRVEWGDPGGTRVAGRAAGDPATLVVNDRYRHEHPFLVSGSLLHQLCSPVGEPTTHAREVLLHALLAVAQTQLLDVVPELADEGTELARRQHTLVLSLLNSRPRGRSRVRIVAPDGAGTIPGGAATMATPDFWSIPFAVGDDPSPAPPAVADVLGPWVPEEVGGVRGSFGRPLVDLVDEHVLDAVLPPALRARAGAALGLLACGPDDPGRRLAPVTVRRAVDADAERLAEIHLAARRDAMPGIVIPHPPDDVVRYHRDEVIPEMDVWVATRAGRAVGSVALTVGWVHHLYVDPAWTRQGIGARLLDLAVRREPDGVDLWVFQVNGGARRFYERHGLRPVRFTAGLGNEERAPDLLERWRPPLPVAGGS